MTVAAVGTREGGGAAGVVGGDNNSKTIYTRESSHP